MFLTEFAIHAVCGEYASVASDISLDRGDYRTSSRCRRPAQCKRSRHVFSLVTLSCLDPDLHHIENASHSPLIALVFLEWLRCLQGPARMPSLSRVGRTAAAQEMGLIVQPALVRSYPSSSGAIHPLTQPITAAAEQPVTFGYPSSWRKARLLAWWGSSAAQGDGGRVRTPAPTKHSGIFVGAGH